MNTKDRISVVQMQYFVVYKDSLTEECVNAIVRDWESSGCPPEFLDGLTERVVRTYQPLYDVVSKYLHQVGRKK